MDDNNRESFKANFLRKIIIRIDFKGVISIDNTIDKVHNFLFKNGFSNFDEEHVNEMDLELKDPEIIETKYYLPLKELKQTKSFIFTSDIVDSRPPEFKFEISKYFAMFDINPHSYTPFEHYISIFAKLVMLIKGNNEFFKAIRLGIRKINNLYFWDMNKIPLYLEAKYYAPPFISLKDEFDLTFTKSEGLDSFTFEDTNFNFIRYMDKGLLQEKEAYQTILDLDGYIKDQDSLTTDLGSELLMTKRMIKINQHLFQLFCACLTNRFKQNLRDEKIMYEDLIGVTLNGNE